VPWPLAGASDCSASARALDQQRCGGIPANTTRRLIWAAMLSSRAASDVQKGENARRDKEGF
jgi:hypothetical protein